MNFGKKVNVFIERNVKFRTKRKKGGVNAFHKIHKCIESIKKEEQIEPLKNMIKLYENQYPYKQDVIACLHVLFREKQKTIVKTTPIDSVEI